MDQKPTLMDRFQQMPRALRWAALAVIGVALFLFWDEFLHPVAEKWDREAAAIESNINDVRGAATEARKLQNARTSNVVKAIGPVRVPVSMAEGSKMLNDLMLSVLEKHRATNIVPNQRPRGRLPKNALTNVVPGKRVDRLACDLKFDATPQAAIAIIAELESSEHIESINSVRILRDTAGRVKVHLNMESWLVVSENTPGATI